MKGYIYVMLHHSLLGVCLTLKEMQPTLDEIQAALNKAVLMILNVSHVVKRWGQSSHKDLTTRPKHVTLQGNDDCLLVYISLPFYRIVLIFQLKARPNQFIFPDN